MNQLADSQLTKADKILVVDDSPDNVLLVQTILEEEGYEVITAEDGRSALSQLKDPLPDLILLDVMMPGMDGYEVTRRIRANQKLPFIPILLITAHERSSIVQGLDMGADDFIRKPVELEELLARVRSSLRLKHIMDERDQIARQREDFVSRLAHDLRTPLVAADKMLDLIQQGAMGTITPDCSEALRVMARSNQNLLRMVNTLLEVYRYEANRKNLNFLKVDLQELIQEVAQELTPLANSKGLDLKIDFEKPLENASIMGDRLELHRLMTNLIGNAIQYTDVGKVRVCLSTTSLPTATQAKKKGIKIEVEDTGIGIPEEEQVKLFERFRQGKHNRAGSGLGLHLSRQIVEAHQGIIQVLSQTGQGSTFTVWLPAEI